MKIEKVENQIKLFRYRWFRNSCRDFLPTNIFDPKTIGIEYSSTDLNGTFLFSQLFLDILLRVKSSSNDKDKFVSACAKKYKDSTQQMKFLQEFNINYRENDALEWYACAYFIFLPLNKALRVQDIDFLFLFRFFIRDLKNELEKRKCDYPVQVYRGQLMSKRELSHLEELAGQFISMNSFFSTSLNKDVALHFLGAADANVNQAPHEYEKVLLEVDADPHLSGGVPAFANITGFSIFYEEEEILFTAGSIFRLNHVRRDSMNPYLTIVSMTLCGNDDNKLKPVLDTMKKEYQVDNATTSPDGEDPTLMSLGIVLLNMGCFSSAKKFFFRMLHTLHTKPVSVDMATCYRYIGEVYRQKRNFRKSKWWYRKALAMYASVLPNDDPSVAATYMCLGHTCSKTTDWKFSTWYQTDLYSK